MKLITALALAGALCVTAAHAQTSVDLQFDGSGSSLEATGFDGAYGLNTTGFQVGGGQLTILTLPGDTYGDYENDPDTAQNFFWSAIDPLEATTVDAKVTYNNLNSNFHGGGIWMGTDQDHYIRLGLIHNSFEGGLVVEALRENEDQWTVHGGPGGDIIGRNGPVVAQPGSTVDVYLKLVRTGTTAQAFYSLDGLTYNQVGDTFENIALSPADGATVEGNFKVGAYALGGGASPATASFDYLVATSVPEPGSLLAMAGGLSALMGMHFRKRRI